MPHVDEGVLHAYIDGALDTLSDAGELPDGMKSGDVVSHLSTCADCRARLEEERSIRERAGLVLRDSALPHVDTPPFAGVESRRQARARRTLPLAWAASVVLAVGAGWWGSALWRGDRLVQEQALSEAAAPAVTPSTMTDAAAEAPPAAVTDRPERSAGGATAGSVANTENTGRPAQRFEPAPVRADADVSVPPAEVAARLEEQRSAPAAPVTLEARSAGERYRAAAAPLAQRAVVESAGAGAITTFITPGPEMLAFESALAREQSGAFIWQTLARSDTAAFADQLYIVRDATDPAIAVAREVSQTTVRVRQTLANGQPVELIMWRQHAVALDEIAVTGAGRALAPAPVAAAADKVVIGALRRSAAGPRPLHDGRQELVLFDEAADTWIALRAAVPPEELLELSHRLVRPGETMR